MTKVISASGANSLLPVFAGLDVGSQELVLALRMDGRPQDGGSFPNSPAGVRSLVKRLKALKRPVFAAMVASRCDPHVRAFTEMLKRRGKKKLQALVAAMRKLLHAIWGMFKTKTTFNGSLLFPQLTPEPLTSQ